MTPRERVRCALRHEQPDRVPFSWQFGTTAEMAEVLTAHFARQGMDWPRLRRAAEDILTVAAPYAGPELPARTDIWGIRRRAVSYGTGRYDEIEHYPLAGLADAAALASYPWPSADHYDYAALPPQVERARHDGRAVKLGLCGNPFEIYCWMTGLEESLVNVLLRPELVRAAEERITGFYAEKMRRSLALCAQDVDLVFIADDLGSQTGLLMSRDAYREVVQPFHRRLAALAHGMAPRAAVMFHSDGAVFEVVPDLIEAGVDVLEAVQVDAAGMEPERLKAVFGERLVFHGAISVQALLPRNDAWTVEQECRRLVSVLGAGGGYIAAPSHAIQVGTPPENVAAMLRGVLGAEDLAAAMAAARGGDGSTASSPP